MKPNFYFRIPQIKKEPEEETAKEKTKEGESEEKPTTSTVEEGVKLEEMDDVNYEVKSAPEEDGEEESLKEDEVTNEIEKEVKTNEAEGKTAQNKVRLVHFNANFVCLDFTLV